MNIEQIREFCLSLPAVEEDLKWGDNLVFSIKGKMFCIFGLDKTPLTMSFKASDDDFTVLSQKADFIPAPYLARAKWLLIKDVSGLNEDLLKHYLNQSYSIIKNKLSKKLQKEIDSY